MIIDISKNQKEKFLTHLTKNKKIICLLKNLIWVGQESAPSNL